MSELLCLENKTLKAVLVFITKLRHVSRSLMCLCLPCFDYDLLHIDGFRCPLKALGGELERKHDTITTIKCNLCCLTAGKLLSAWDFCWVMSIKPFLPHSCLGALASVCYAAVATPVLFVYKCTVIGRIKCFQIALQKIVFTLALFTYLY